MNKKIGMVMVIAAAVAAMTMASCGKKAEEKANDSKPAAQAVSGDVVVTDNETTDADDETTTEEETVTAEETVESAAE
ncbi:hypothetical protein [uncultured Ruminococcus sp.]|jgi:hypothetical protein|uniref:hypothetical protein n=1 Tax=uncultured Ruminococcus sp. TaxID=165186 RepID=UPI0025ECC58F|nr:hypothetical protein [uncultured Ruminococcus sp.]